MFKLIKQTFTHFKIHFRKFISKYVLHRLYRSREGHFQARPHDVPLFAWTGTTVPSRTIYGSDLGIVFFSTRLSTRLHGTSPITSLQPSKSHLDIGYVPPTDTGSLCLAVESTRTVAGTHCSQMNSEIRRVMSTASNSSLKQSCSASTSATSAFAVNFNVTRSINSRFTCLLCG